MVVVTTLGVQAGGSALKSSLRNGKSSIPSLTQSSLLPGSMSYVMVVGKHRADPTRYSTGNNIQAACRGSIAVVASIDRLDGIQALRIASSAEERHAADA